MKAYKTKCPNCGVSILVTFDDVSQKVEKPEVSVVNPVARPVIDESQSQTQTKQLKLFVWDDEKD